MRAQVEGLARFHQDRLMQVQVELKTVRQEIKKLHRAKLQPLRARRHKRGLFSTSPMMNLLDRQVVVFRDEERQRQRETETER
jgi:hypothetical protein